MKNLVIEAVKKLLCLFFLFPIKQNRVFFSSYSGRQYSCNPKAVTEWLLGRHSTELEIIWAFVDPETVHPVGIRTVKFKSLRYIYYLLTSKVVVDNVESWSILPKRKGQFTINTWHGGGAYKGVGLMRMDASNATDANMLRKNERISLYLSSSRAFTQMTLRESFRYQGEVLEAGMPRNDILVNGDPERARKVREHLCIAGDAKVVIYAPTFRHDLNYQYTLQYGELLHALQERFGGDWVLLIRSHYYVKDNAIDSAHAINVSDYPDMQELLLISDVLITDYSSSMWDFSLMYKPGFLYMPDYQDYMNEREFYTPVEEWPYPACFSMNDLTAQIKAFEPEASLKRIQRHHADLGSFECGTASEAVGKRIMHIVSGQ